MAMLEPTSPPRRTGLLRIWALLSAPLAMLLIAACSPASDPAAADASSTGTGAPSQTSPAPSTGPSPSPTRPGDRLTIAPTDATISTLFDVNVRAASADSRVAVDLTDDFGTINFDGRALQAIAYYEQPWSAFDVVIYQTLALDAQGAYVFFIYCSNNSVTTLMYETPDGQGLMDLAASGSCTPGNSGTLPHVTLPAVDAAMPSSMGNFHINGSALQLDGPSPGRIKFGGASAQLVVFSIVDCTKVCGAQPWYELHSLLIAPSGRVTIGILYLFQDNPEMVQLAYCISLPDLQLSASTVYDATWSGSVV